jgi:hypothetical protein
MSLDPRDRKILFGGAAVLVVLIAFAALMPSDEPQVSEFPSSYSASSGGAKAAYTLLEESGYHVARWTEPPMQLPSDAHGITLILAAPSEPPSEDERSALERFVKSGGRILATGFVSTGAIPGAKYKAGPPSFTWTKFPALIPSPITRGAPEITMIPGIRWRDAAPDQLPLYGDESGNVVLKYRYEQGEVIWWAGATPLTNAGLRESGNLELFLNCVGDPQGTTVLWDEYYHGYRRGVIALLRTTPLPWALLQVGIVLMAAIFTFSRRSGPLHEPVEPSRLSPLEYVETLGGLYRRAHAADVAVQVALERFRYLIARKLGLSPTATPEQLYEALRTRWRFDNPDFVSVLHDCESARFDTSLSDSAALKMVQALQQYAVELKLIHPSGDQH